MKHGKRLRRIVIIAACLLLCASAAVFGLQQYGAYQMRKLPALSFAEALAYTTKNNAEAVITVGIIRDGQAS